MAAARTDLIAKSSEQKHARGRGRVVEHIFITFALISKREK